MAGELGVVAVENVSQLPSRSCRSDPWRRRRSSSSKSRKGDALFSYRRRLPQRPFARKGQNERHFSQKVNNVLFSLLYLEFYILFITFGMCI